MPSFSFVPYLLHVVALLLALFCASPTVMMLLQRTRNTFRSFMPGRIWRTTYPHWNTFHVSGKPLNCL